MIILQTIYTYIQISSDNVHSYNLKELTDRQHCFVMLLDTTIYAWH